MTKSADTKRLSLPIASWPRRDADAWSRSAIKPCDACGFPPDVHSHEEAIGRYLLPDTALHSRATTRVRAPDAYQEEDLDDW